MEAKNHTFLQYEDANRRSVYTELFLYYNTATSQSSYGLISYNSKTGKTTHKIQIDYDSYDLMIALNKAMLYMQQSN